MEPAIRRHGGIASRAELLAAGWTPTDLWLADRFGDLDRIRRGWYASSELPDDARAAWRAGGPLAALRPSQPELTRYRTPVDGLYLTGAATFPGAGIWGASGRNCAMTILRDRG